MFVSKITLNVNVQRQTKQDPVLQFKQYHGGKKKPTPKQNQEPFLKSPFESMV